MKYKGSCHCGKVRFEVEGDLNGAMSCNCSMCSRKGSLLWLVPRDQLHMLTSEEQSESNACPTGPASGTFSQKL